MSETRLQVAVKVQRPFVLETVSLDLHLARAAGQFLRKLSPEVIHDILLEYRMH